MLNVHIPKGPAPFLAQLFDSPAERGEELLLVLM